MVFFASACAETKPVWLPNGNHPAFSTGQYLIGIGVATRTRDKDGDIQRADANARAEIAKQIQVHLEEQMLSVSEHRIENHGGSKPVRESSNESITIRNRQHVIFTVEGVEIIDRFFDEKAKCHYSMAVMHKARTSARLTAEAEDLYEQSAQLEHESDTLLSRNELVMSIQKLIVATQKYEDADTKRMVASICGGPQILKIRENPCLKLNQILEKIHIICLSGNGQHAQIGRSLPEPVKVMAIYDRDIPVARLPLLAQFQARSEKSDMTVHCDDKGVAVITVSDIGKTGKEENALKIGPAWRDVVRAALKENSDAWQDRLRSPILEVGYKLRTENTSNVIIISSIENMDTVIKLEKFNHRLIRQLKESGFTVKGIEICNGQCTPNEVMKQFADKADLLVLVDGSIAFSGYRAGFPIYRAHMTLTCCDLIRKDISATSGGESIAGASDKTKAAQKAIYQVLDELSGDFVRKMKERLQ